MNLNNVKSGSLRWLRAEELPLPVDSWPLEMVFLGVNESSNIKYFAIDVHGPATSSPADLPAIAATGVSGAGSPSALHGTDLQSGAGRLRGAAVPPALATRQDQSLATPFAAASAVSAGRGYAPEKINGTETMTEALTMHVRRGTRAPPENPSLLDDTLGELERFVDVRLSLAFITDPAEVTAVSMARSLMYFHQSHGFCARCGARTGQWERLLLSSSVPCAMTTTFPFLPPVTLAASQQGGSKRKCPHCGASHYPRTDPAVIGVVSQGKDRILLGRNADHLPGYYSCLSGFMGIQSSFFFLFFTHCEHPLPHPPLSLSFQNQVKPSRRPLPGR